MVEGPKTGEGLEFWVCALRGTKGTDGITMIWSCWTERKDHRTLTLTLDQRNVPFFKHLFVFPLIFLMVQIQQSVSDMMQAPDLSSGTFRNLREQ